MENYNFYGDYDNENPESFSFSVFEIHKQQEEREDKRIMIYNKILKRVFRRIKVAVEKSEVYCFFQLPEFIPGFPIYNMTECLFYIQNFLTSKGFEHKYCNDLLIFITWKPKERSLKLENLHNNTNSKPKLITEEPDYFQRNNTKPKKTFRPISDYQPKGDFLYNSNPNKNKKNQMPKKREITLNF